MVRPSARRTPKSSTARISRRLRVGMELAKQSHLEPRLFPGLAHRSLLDRFSPVDKAAGQSPAERFELALDKDDAAVDFNDDVDGESRLTAFLHDRAPAR